MKLREETGRLTKLAVLAAIVIVFQLIGSFIHIGPTSVSLVLIPIVIGGIVTDTGGGLFLGFLFGCMTLFAGINGSDFFTQVLFNAHPLGTTVLCLGKASFAGLGAALVYKVLAAKNRTLAVFAAAAAAPIINTGLFIVGALALVYDTIAANFAGGSTVLSFLVIGCAGLNFIAELAVNLILSPAICTIVSAFKKGRGKKS